MQVGRIGIAQMMFPGFRPREMGQSTIYSRPFPGTIYSRPWPSQLYHQPRTEEIEIPERATHLVEQPRTYVLGQTPPAPQTPAAPLPLSIAFDDAQKMLTSAENIAKGIPACNLPILNRFRAYIAAGNQGQPLNLTADESAQLQQFRACAESKGTSGFTPASPAETVDYVPFVIGTVVVAGLVGYWLWKGQK